MDAGDGGLCIIVFIRSNFCWWSSRVYDSDRRITSQISRFEGGDVTAVDPICKMQVDEKTAKWKTEYKAKFLKEPEDNEKGLS
ncbi:MAG: hypothetical protein ACE5HW_04005 [Candidatus Methanofastidiosia archaeon]